MTYEEIQNIFQTPFLNSWEHDYYVMVFQDSITTQELLDHAYNSITGLTGIWFHIIGNTCYVVVPKGTVIPDDFAITVSPITDVPEQPIEEPAE